MSDLSDFAMGFFLGCLLCLSVTYVAVTEAWRKDAIDRGVAEYHHQTGQWQWKEAKQ